MMMHRNTFLVSSGVLGTNGF